MPNIIGYRFKVQSIVQSCNIENWKKKKKIIQRILYYAQHTTTKWKDNCMKEMEDKKTWTKKSWMNFIKLLIEKWSAVKYSLNELW